MNGYRLCMVVVSAVLLSLPFWIEGPIMDLAGQRHPLHPERIDPPIEGRVLLVGDGTFHGVGIADGESFGEVLEVRRRTAVRLHALDGLRELPNWLAVERPKVVLIGLGADELALEPLPWTRVESEVLSEWLGREVDSSAAGSPFIGRWRFGAIPIVFEASGAAQMGEDRGTWAFDGERLVVEGEGRRGEWIPSLEGELLVLAPIDGVGVQIECVPEFLSENPLERALRCIDEGHLVEWDLRAPAASRGGIPKPLFDQGRVWVETLRGSAPVASWPPSYAVVRPLDEAASERLEQTLIDLVHAVRRVGAEPVLLGHTSALADRDAIARKVAESNGVRFLEAPGAGGAASEATFVHAAAPGYWNEAGHQRWVELLEGELKR